MSDRFKIDSHKLSYHIPHLYQWLQGKNIYPIYMEIGLYRGCNHRCVFCAYDFLNYKPFFLDVKQIEKFILEARAKGVKAVLFSGEGEPLLHQDACRIISFTRRAGIDVALATNGVMLTAPIAKKILKHLSWLKVSLNAGTKKTYAKVHRTKPSDFNLVLDNLKTAVKIRNSHHYACAIGAQSVLLPDNFSEMTRLAKKIRDLGLDYFVVKPYSRHCFSRHRQPGSLRFQNLQLLKKHLQQYSRGSFQVIFRDNTMHKLEQKKPYAVCLGFAFTAHIACNGEMYPCTAFIGNKEFSFGNINEDSLRDIWEGRRRKAVVNKIYRNWDIQRCRPVCRIDEINRYLWELKHPVEHINFI